jgi:hypothetical protein
VASFVIGSTAAGFKALSVRVPLDGSTYDPIQMISTSLGGTSTLNRVAVKRRYQWPMKMMSPADWTALRDMWLTSAGPYWLWDASEKFAQAPEPYAPSTAAGWLVVLIEGMSRSHPNSAKVTPTITLREV